MKTMIENDEYVGREAQEERLRTAVEQRVGRALRTPADFDYLVMKMKHDEAELVSVSTLKRLWGYVRAAGPVRTSTLSVLARFLGFIDFEDFCRSEADESGFLSQKQVRVTDLQAGDKVRICWQPGRTCLLRYQGEGRFVVVRAERAKLHVGDTFAAVAFRTGHPFYATDLRRPGIDGARDYVAAARHGLTTVEREERQDDD